MQWSTALKVFLISREQFKLITTGENLVLLSGSHQKENPPLPL